MRVLLALAIALTLTIGCTASGQTGFDYLDEADYRINQGHRKLARQAIADARAWFQQHIEPTPGPEPEPEPEPEPPVSVPFAVWPASDPAYLLLDRVGGGVQYSHLDNPKVDGLSIRERWSKINPSDGVYDFSSIHQLAAHAKQRGKWWTLRIMAGTNAPKWLDCPTYSDGDGTFPLPWCPEYAVQYDRLMLRLGMEFGDDPLLAMVHVSGFDESAEMHMPSKGPVNNGWPTNEMSDAWEHRIDVTSAAFPRQLICLNHSPENWSAAVRQWHMATVGKQRAAFQMNALKGTTNTNWIGYTTLEDLSNGGWHVGFQMVGTGSRVAPFDVALDKGEAAGAHWYEVYQGEVGDLP